MTKTFVLRFSKNAPVKINFSYPDFKKEGLAAFYTIFDWVSHLTILAFFVFVYFVKSTDIFQVVYSAAAVLFAVQLIRFVLGGFSYFPKTTLDVGGLMFVAFTIVAILISNTQEISLFGEGKLSFISGMSSFALLLVYYLTVSQSVLRGSSGFIKKAIILAVILLGFKLIDDRTELLTKEISVSYYLPLTLPFLFFTYLQSKKFIKQILSVLAIGLVLYLTNFNDFSFTFALLVSLFMLFLLILLGGSEFLYNSITKLGEGIGKFFRRKINIFELLKTSGKFLIGSIGFFSVFIFSIVKSVENFSDNFSKGINIFKNAWEGFEGTKEMIFGKGLDTFTGSFYADTLESYGLLGLAGFVALTILALLYILRTLKKAYKEKNSKLSLLMLGIFSSFLSLLIYMKLESVTFYAYLLFWFFIILIGAFSTGAIYKSKVAGNVVTGISKSKNGRMVAFMKVVGISILTVIAIISVYLILKK